jgi:hypothetical protein
MITESRQISLPSAKTAVMAVIFASAVAFIVAFFIMSATESTIRSIYKSHNSALSIASSAINLMSSLVSIAILAVLVRIANHRRKEMFRVALLLLIGSSAVAFMADIFRQVGVQLFVLNRLDGLLSYVAFLGLPLGLAVMLFFVAGRQSAS